MLQVPFLLSAPGMGEAVEAIRSAGSSIDNVAAFLQKVRDTPRRDAAAAKAAAAAAAAEERMYGMASPPPLRSAKKPPTAMRTPARTQSLGHPGAGNAALRPPLTPFGNLLAMARPLAHG